MKITLNFMGCGCLIALLFSWWTDRTLDFWCSYVAGHTVDIPFILSFLVTLFLSGLAMGLNLISEIARACIG